MSEVEQAVHTENVCSCYSVFVLKNVTVTMPEDLALWARRKAAEEDCSVSKLLCKLVEKERARGDSSKLAHEAWKNRVSLNIDADQRMPRRSPQNRPYVVTSKPAIGATVGLP